MRLFAYLFVVLVVFLLLPSLVSPLIIDPGVRDVIAREGEARVIIRFSQEPVRVEKGRVVVSHHALTQRRALTSLLARSLRHQQDLSFVNSVAGVLTSDGLSLLERSGLDVLVVEDKLLHLHPVAFDPHPHLDVSTAVIGANYSWNVLNLTGRNVTVAVIDSGIDYTHPDLGGCFGPGCRVKDGFDFVNNDADPMDDSPYSHGMLLVLLVLMVLLSVLLLVLTSTR